MSSKGTKLLRSILPEASLAPLLKYRELLHAQTWTLKTRLSWSLRQPATLNEKIRYKMAFDRRPLLVQMADKWGVREYVAQRVGKQVLNEVYGLVSDPRDIDFTSLPQRFVVKPTHASGAVIIFHDSPDQLPESAAIPDGNSNPPCVTRKPVWLQRNAFDREFFFQKCDQWLANPYSLTEWAYRKIKHRLIIERYLENQDGSRLRDYKLFVFHGKVHWILVHSKSPTGVEASCHWPDWTPIPVRRSYPRPEQLPDPPGTLKEMIEISEKLGAETDMIRVDLYEIDKKVVFGELTNYPAGGTALCEPPEYESILGRGWTPPWRYHCPNGNSMDSLQMAHVD